MTDEQVHRQEEEPEEEKKEEGENISAKGSEGGEVPSSVAREIHSLSGGRSLGQPERNFFEPRFGADFSRVKIHDDERAAQTANAINAKAYTKGNNVVFGKGEYQPESSDGKRLMAHELTHVVQQGGVRSSIVYRNQNQIYDAEDFDRLFLALIEARTAYFNAISRYRNWLTRNLLRFLGDVLVSGESSALVQTRGFAANLGVTMVGDTFGTIGSQFGKAVGENLLRLFFQVRTARFIGGIIGFIASAIIDTFIGAIFDERARIIRQTIDIVSEYITRVINPSVDELQHNVIVRFNSLEEITRQLRSTSRLNANQWREVESAFNQAKENANQLYLNTYDLTYYRHISLYAGVYPGRVLAAESESELPTRLLGLLTGNGDGSFNFMMQHRVVRTENTAINVTENNSIIVIRSRSRNCIINRDNLPSNLDAPSVQDTLPRKYSINLYELGVINNEIDLTREFNVGEKEYGFWYRVPRGRYYLLIHRIDSHPIGLCGNCFYWVIPPSRYSQRRIN